MFNLSSCSKDDDQVEIIEGPASSAQNESLRMAKSFMEETYANFRKEGTSQFMADAIPIREELMAKKAVSYSKSGGEEIPLSDIFLIYEGAINSIHTLPVDSTSEIESYTSTFTVDVFEEEGQYFITVDEYNEFYADILTNINQVVNVSANEYLAVADLNLTSLTPNQASVQVNLIKGISTLATPVPSYPTPGGPIYGAQLAGWCNVPNTQGVDAAVIAQGHVNGLSLAATTNCPVGTIRMPIIAGSWDANTTNQSALIPIIGQSTQNILGSYYWKSHANTCVGDAVSWINEAEWTTLLNKASVIAFDPQAISYYNSQIPASSLFVANIQSRSGQPNYPDPHTNINFYHSGIYTYGIIICQ